MLDFAQCEQLVSKARDRQSKPIANNTRIERRDKDTYALRLHATDIATFHRDGRITINSGGWQTVTTKDRLRGAGVHVATERGLWYVQAQPDPNDPEPPYGGREVLKPFHALNPGPEPVKPAEGCLAGTERIAGELRRMWVKEEDRLDDDVTLEHDERGYFTGGYIEREVQVLTHYFEQVPNRWSPDYERQITEIRDLLELREREPDRIEIKFEQCPHCKLFDAQHRAWEGAMNGSGWGRERTHGYVAMVEALDRYGSREAWQEAYIADFRAAREARKLHKEWVERSRVPFEDGMEITADGYAPRPDPKTIARAQRQLKKTEKAKQRINKFVSYCCDELEAGNVPMPSGGDCWGCLFRAEDQSIEPMGVDHLEDHIRERYVVPSMLINAMRSRGYIDAGIGIHLGMDPENGRMGASFYNRDSVERALRKYLYDRLIPAISERKVTV